MKLTTKAIENLKPGPARREIADAHMPGLYLVVQPSGARGWCARYRHLGASRKMPLGGWPQVDLASARKLAATALRAVAEGRDPGREKIEARSARSGSVATLADEFLERHVRRNYRRLWIAEVER